jgi:hypothetical protein
VELVSQFHSGSLKGETHMATISKKAAAAIATLIDGVGYSGERRDAALKDGRLYDFWDASLSEALCIIELADRFGIEMRRLDVTRDLVDNYREKEAQHRPEEFNWSRE